MSRRIAAMDASSTLLGDPADWPAPLLGALRLMLPSMAQIVLFWGPDLIAFYNDAYAPTIGDKHPHALGRPAREGWAELWDDLGPLLRKVIDEGETVFAKDRPFYLERHGYGETVYFDISYSPVPDEAGRVCGVLCIVNETTLQMRAQEELRAERARLASMFDQAPSFMALLEGPDHIFTLANAAYRRLVQDRDVIGKPAREVLPELSGQGFFELLDRVYREGEAFQGRAVPLTLGEGAGVLAEPRLLDFMYQPIKDSSGLTSGIFVEGVDVTERINALERQRESESMLGLATKAAAIGIWDFDPKTGDLRWSARCRELFGLPADAPVSYEETFLGGLHPDDVERVDATMRAALDPASGGQVRMEYRVRDAASRAERWVAADGHAIFMDGVADRLIGTAIDVTDRKQAEAAIAASQDALREESQALEILNRTIGSIAGELDLDRLVQTVVDAGVALTGAQFGAFFYNVSNAEGESYMLYSLAGVERAAFADFPMPRNTAIFSPTFMGEGVMRSDDITADPRYGLSAPYYGMPKGHLPVHSYLAVPVISRYGEVIGGLFFGHGDRAVFNERSERLMHGLAAQAAIGIDNARLFQAEQRLNRTLEEQVAARTLERDRIWNLSRDPFLVADGQGRWISVSPAWTEILGWSAEELLGRTSEWMEHPIDRAKTRAEIVSLIDGETTTRFENRFRTTSGDYRWFSWTAVSSEGLLYCVARDITGEKEASEALKVAEDALRQAQKMETVGQLTGGVAHDFNNLLQIVTGNLELLLRRLPEQETRLRQAADNAMTGAKRAATLTQRLLAFSRRQPLAPRRVDVNVLAARVSELMHRTLGEMVKIKTVQAPSLWRVEVDPNQLETALINLAVNGRDAMPEGGTLTVETSNTHIDRDYVARHAEVTAGDYVVICVTDTGTGMDEPTVQRAFDPFFTTKEVGKGTGLGLSMVYGFVKQSGGHVKVYSEIGHGTTVRLYLPRHVGVDDEEEEPAPQAPAPKASREETILVCEDDDDVRAYSASVLRELGYKVLEAPDGPAALGILERPGLRIDLLFTDVVLPGGMTGATLARRASVVIPGLKVLFTTGYARNAIVHHGRLDPGVELITKPFTYSDLAMRVRQVLDAAEQPSTGIVL